MTKDLFRSQVKFLIGAKDQKDIREYPFPEFAFIGRSNVGKSTMINALFNNSKIARTSKTPGRTQQLNFFSVADKFIVVDLPGYGYAKVNKQEIDNWMELISHYLQTRSKLKRLFVLVDSRHGIKDSDIETMKFLDYYGISYQIILTKIDKTKKAELDEVVKNINSILENHPAAYSKIILTSAEKRIGIKEVQHAIETLI